MIDKKQSQQHKNIKYLEINLRNALFIEDRL